MPEPGQRQVLAFDFGTRRMGVAFGQELLGSARPVAMLRARDGIPDWDQLERLLTEWQPHHLVVGLPLNMDGTENDMCARARKFGKRLHGRFHLPVSMVDERLSSYEAKGRVLREQGHRDFGEQGVDDLAAVLILQTWYHQDGH